MTDYSDLVTRLRDQSWVMIAEEAADRIEHLMKEIDVLDDHWRKDKARIAELEEEIDRSDEWAKGFIEKADARMTELEAALKPFADASDLHMGSDDMSIAFGIIIGNLRQASKVLGEKE